jgi:Trk K+ transport system NAD-binding subunit
MLGAIVVLMRWVLPAALRYAGRSQELLVLLAVTWAVVLASGAELLGFSKEVGAFLAGVSLASTEQRDAIGARLVVLRDFLLLFFFISLGAQLDLSALRMELGRAIVFSVFVLIGNPLIVMAIMGAMGYRKRTGFMAGLAVAQISEFSLILAALGHSLGHLDDRAMSLITLVGLVTIFASTYMILYSGPLYSRLAGVLGVFERTNAHRESPVNAVAVPWGDHLIILMGLGNYGSAIAWRLRQHGWHLLAVDFDPQALERARGMGLAVLYGDVGDPEMLNQLSLDGARWVLCTVRDRQLNVSLLGLLRERDFAGRIAMTAVDATEAEEYRRLGAHLVLQPFSDAAEQAVEAITGSIQALSGLRDWPVVVEEVSLQPGSVFAGQMLRELDLRGELGVSVLAVSRAGKVHCNSSPDLRMYPGDRVVLLCPSEQASRAVEFLRQRELGAPQDRTSAFNADEIRIHFDSPWIGKSLAELGFRNRHGVTVIGIRRGELQLTSPRASDILQPNDSIVVVGSPEGVAELKVSQQVP